jgi:cytochrome c5
VNSARRTGEQDRSAPRLQRVAIAVFVMSLLAASDAMAQSEGRSGKDVVKATCASCHATGANGAPRIGDKQAWSKRAAQGLSSLTRHALDGIRKMPAHGGNLTLTDLEIGRAVAYMVNQSGGKWIEPVSAKDLAAERSGEQVVKAQCVKCHKDGVGGAPRIGDRNAWVPRMKLGLDNLARSAIRGHGGMPPRGGQANLTDAELRSAIIYMFNPAAAPAGRATETAPRAPEDPNHRTAGGIDFYLGIVSAESLRSFPTDSVERTMHGGIPSGRGFYHVNVSLVGAKSQAPINDAQVEVRFEQPGLTSKSVVLEPIGVGAASYGNYVNLREKTSYLITVRVRTAGSSRPVEAKFEHRFD